MNRILASFLFLALAVPFGAGATGNGDVCGETKVITVDSDYFDERVSIDFEDFQNPPGNGTSDQGFYEISVSPNSPYSIVLIELDVADDGQPGYSQSTTTPIGDSTLNNNVGYNPPGDQINSARVTVKKNCPDLCPNLIGDQYEVPEGMVVVEGQCVIPEPPVDVCDNIEGDQATVPDGMVQVGDDCVTPDPEPVDLCPEAGVQTTLPCEEVATSTPPVVEPPTNNSGSSNDDSGSSHRSSGGGIVWCTSTRTTFCRPPEGFSGSPVDNSDEIQAIKDKLIPLIQQLIWMLQQQINNMPSVGGGKG